MQPAAGHGTQMQANHSEGLRRAHEKRENALLRDYSVLPPKWVAWLGEQSLRVIHAFLDAAIPPPLRVIDLAFTGYAQAEVIRTLCALGVAEALGKGPKTAEELAVELGCADAERLYRVLRFATIHGIFDTLPASRKPPQTAGSVRFHNNRLSACLRGDHPNSQKSIVHTLVGRQQMSSGWGELEWGIQTGGLIFEKVHGRNFWEYLASVEGLELVFSQGMSDLDNICGPSIVSDYAWGKHSRFVDIGSAHGGFLAKLLTNNAGTTGVLFDQPQVIERAEMSWNALEDRRALMPRVSFVRGDFFVPSTMPTAQAPGTCYILRQILHDWPDDRALAILRSIRTAIGDSASTLALVEAVILPSASPTSLFMNRARAASDLHMMVSLNGKERDPDQWKQLLDAAGFQLLRIVRTRSPYSILEALPRRLSP